MLVMLNTLMDISEAESGAMQLQREPVVCSDVVARAVDLYRDVADAKGVTLDVRDAADDGRRCRRSHAARASGREPARQRRQIHAVRRPRASSRSSGEGTARLLRIRDTGMGIPRGRVAAYLGSVVPRRRQPHRAGTGSWASAWSRRSSRRMEGLSASSRARPWVHIYCFVAPSRGPLISWPPTSNPHPPTSNLHRPPSIQTYLSPL